MRCFRSDVSTGTSTRLRLWLLLRYPVLSFTTLILLLLLTSFRHCYGRVFSNDGIIVTDAGIRCPRQYLRLPLLSPRGTCSIVVAPLTPASSCALLFHHPLLVPPQADDIARLCQGARNQPELLARTMYRQVSPFQRAHSRGPDPAGGRQRRRGFPGKSCLSAAPRIC